MVKIQGVKNLLVYLDSVGYPLSEQQIDEFMLARNIPYSQPHQDVIVFDQSHIEWWLAMQRKKDSEG